MFERLGTSLGFWIFVILLAGLILRNWQGANALAKTGFVGSNTIIQTLQK